MEVHMELLDKKTLLKGCGEVIDVLDKYRPEYKIGILHYLIDTFPYQYELIELKESSNGVPSQENN